MLVAMANVLPCCDIQQLHCWMNNIVVAAVVLPAVKKPLKFVNVEWDVFQ